MIIPFYGIEVYLEIVGIRKGIKGQVGSRGHKRWYWSNWKCLTMITHGSNIWSIFLEMLDLFMKILQFGLLNSFSWFWNWLSCLTVSEFLFHLRFIQEILVIPSNVHIFCYFEQNTFLIGDGGVLFASFQNQRDKSVFNHVLCPLIFKMPHNLTPLLPLKKDKLD